MGRTTHQGACSTCSSSKVTLKSGVENMLMHYVPEACIAVLWLRASSALPPATRGRLSPLARALRPPLPLPPPRPEPLPSQPCSLLEPGARLESSSLSVFEVRCPFPALCQDALGMGQAEGRKHKDEWERRPSTGSGYSESARGPAARG